MEWKVRKQIRSFAFISLVLAIENNSWADVLPGPAQPEKVSKALTTQSRVVHQFPNLPSPLLSLQNLH